MAIAPKKRKSAFEPLFRDRCRMRSHPAAGVWGRGVPMLSFRAHIRRLGSFAAGEPAEVTLGGPLLARNGPEVARPDWLTVR